jgi:phosphoglycolate phosphatase
MAHSTIFCDFDGPIVDVSERYYATYCTALSEVWRASSERAGKNRRQYLSKTQFWTFKQNRIPDRQIAHWSGLEGQNIDRFLAEVSRIVNHASLLHYDQLQPRTRNSLELLHQCGIRVVLVTLRPPQQVIQFLRHHDLEWAIADLFGMGSAASAYQNQTNHKVERLQAAMAAQQRQGYDLRRTWMIGDTEADIMAGQTLGLETVAVTCGIRSDSYLQSFRPTHIIPDLWAAAQRLQQYVTLRHPL